MNENESMTVQAQAEPEIAYDPDDWDDLDMSDLTVEDAEHGEDDAETRTDEPPAPEADQQKAEEEKPEAPAGEEKPEAGQAEADQLFDLKHLGETRQVGKDEVVALAQKGLDYDHIRAERDEARAEVKRLSEFESFLQELATPQNLSIDDLIDTTRAKLLADREKLDGDIALQRVKLDREKKAFEADRQKAVQAKTEQDTAAQKRHSAFVRFAKEYPDVDPKTIPQSIWEKFNAGGDLADLYARHENRILRERVKELQGKVDAAERNAKNRERSAGSQKSAGKGADMDAFDRAWYDGN